MGEKGRKITVASKHVVSQLGQKLQFRCLKTASFCLILLRTHLFKCNTGVPSNYYCFLQPAVLYMRFKNKISQRLVVGRHGWVRDNIIWLYLWLCNLFLCTVYILMCLQLAAAAMWSEYFKVKGNYCIWPSVWLVPFSRGKYQARANFQSCGLWFKMSEARSSQSSNVAFIFIK